LHSIAADLVRVETALGLNPNNLGVGVVDVVNWQVRLFPYDETDAYSRSNPSSLIMAGHEAAVVMAGFTLAESRGFVLTKQGGVWQLFNSSHLNHADGEPNRMRMSPTRLSGVVMVLTTVILQPLIVH
jgi:hypothetical protein